jgi:hypothetical protein
VRCSSLVDWPVYPRLRPTIPVRPPWRQARRPPREGPLLGSWPDLARKPDRHAVSRRACPHSTQPQGSPHRALWRDSPTPDPSFNSIQTLGSFRSTSDCKDSNESLKLVSSPASFRMALSVRRTQKRAYWFIRARRRSKPSPRNCLKPPPAFASRIPPAAPSPCRLPPSRLTRCYVPASSRASTSP